MCVSDLKEKMNEKVLNVVFKGTNNSLNKS